MFDYIFFDESLRDRFVSFVREKGAAAEKSDEGGYMASVPEDIDEALSEEIDTCYEELLQENAELLEGTDDALEKNVAGVRVQLADGTPCTIRLDPDLVARLLQAISLEELRDMVQTIAAAVEDPDDRPLCHT